MTKTEEQINEIHGMVKVLASDSVALKNTVWGNGKPGLQKDVVVLQEAQKHCPARKQAGRDKLTRLVAVVMCCFAFITTIVSVVTLIISKQP